ncbi:hypothetical protein OSTOST_10593 [Ostertagia ostertagi]
MWIVRLRFSTYKSAWLTASRYDAMTTILLLICCAVGFAQDRHRERRPHHPQIEPRYSRLTPFQNEEAFPEPVFGMAHGFPYENMHKEMDREFAEPFPSLKRGRPKKDDDSARQEESPEEPHKLPFPFPKNEKALGSRERSERNTKANQFSHEGPPRPILINGEDNPLFTLPPWINLKEFPIKEVTPPFSNPEEKGGRRPRQRSENGEKPTKHAPLSSGEKPSSGEQSLSPNDKRESEAGAGSDSPPTARPDLRDSGATHQNHGESEEKEAPEHPLAGKIVGVDMRMVAGMYPKNDGSHGPGKFFPIKDWGPELARPPPPLHKNRGVRRKSTRKDGAPNIKEQRKSYKGTKSLSVIVNQPDLFIAINGSAPGAIKQSIFTD